MQQNSRTRYTGEYQKEISFPLGGIGSGSIGLAGNGRLTDWEIFNHPDKGSYNGFSHIAVKAEQGGALLDARVLNGDLQKDFTGQYRRENFKGFGYGPFSETMAGFPHFAQNDFLGEFPLAELRFDDPHFPGTVTLRAFNPMIPLNEDDSSLPAAFFEVEFCNPLETALDYTAAFSVKNPFPEQSRNLLSRENGQTKLFLTQEKLTEGDIGYGDLCLASDGEETSVQENWYRGNWFDGPAVYWRNFKDSARLENRRYEAPGSGDMATLAVHLHTEPGEKKSVRFVLAWSFPNCYNYWKPLKRQTPQGERDVTWKNYYAVLFRDSAATADYALREWERLYRQTVEFKEALFSATIPDVVTEAVSATMSVLKSPTVLRLEDGSFYGFEGVHETEGSCEGNCTHVWGYAYALPFLFPRLERSVRELDYRYNQYDDGEMCFRLQLPAGREPMDFRACVDGQMGDIIRTYRDWKLCGDTEWLRSLWPKVKKALEYAWNPHNKDLWDADKDGVMEGRQHHTLDMELFGPNAWLEGFYLGALKAGAEMAEALGEPSAAQEYLTLFERGKTYLNRELFNGAYYAQNVDLSDSSVIAPFADRGDVHTNNSLSRVKDVYWNSEAKELKYQVGQGCGADQLNAQWHAGLCGLGDIFDPAQAKTALESIYRNNFKPSMRECDNPCRLFCLNDEAGTVICDYPEGVYKPYVSVPYCEETFHGVEYQAAALMVMYGMEKEGLELVEAVRSRYDGARRNPWNEIECGSNYARSMAAYSLIPIYSGFSFDLTKGRIGFAPPYRADRRFFSIWSTDCAWGTVELEPGRCVLRILGGTLELRELGLPFIEKGMRLTATADGAPVTATGVCGAVQFAPAAVIEKELSLIAE